jgi:hypothetical protein
MGMMGVIGSILPILPIILPQNPDRLLQPRGAYQTLLSFQKAEIIYDITFRFVHKFLAKATVLWTR